MYVCPQCDMGVEVPAPDPTLDPKDRCPDCGAMLTFRKYKPAVDPTFIGAADAAVNRQLLFSVVRDILEYPAKVEGTLADGTTGVVATIEDLCEEELEEAHRLMERLGMDDDLDEWESDLMNSTDPALSHMLFLHRLLERHDTRDPQQESNDAQWWRAREKDRQLGDDEYVDGLNEPFEKFDHVYGKFTAAWEVAPGVFQDSLWHSSARRSYKRRPLLAPGLRTQLQRETPTIAWSGELGLFCPHCDLGQPPRPVDNRDDEPEACDTCGTMRVKGAGGRKYGFVLDKKHLAQPERARPYAIFTRDRLEEDEHGKPAPLLRLQHTKTTWQGDNIRIPIVLEEGFTHVIAPIFYPGEYTGEREIIGMTAYGHEHYHGSLDENDWEGYPINMNDWVDTAYADHVFETCYPLMLPALRVHWQNKINAVQV